MKKREATAKLSELVSALALTAVEVQQTFDRDRDATLRQLSDSDVELLARLGLGSLAAPGFRVSEFRVGSQVSIKVSRETGLAITVRPINVGFRLMHGSREASESRIEISVSRVALGAAASMKSE